MRTFEKGQMFFSRKHKDWFKVVDVTYPKSTGEAMYKCIYQNAVDANGRPKWGSYYHSRIIDEMGQFPQGRLAPVLYA